MSKSYNVMNYWGAFKFEYEDNGGNPVINVLYNPKQSLFPDIQNMGWIPKEDVVKVSIRQGDLRDYDKIVDEDGPHRIHPAFRQMVMGEPPVDGFWHLCCIPVDFLQDLINSNQAQNFSIKGWDL